MHVIYKGLTFSVFGLLSLSQVVVNYEMKLVQNKSMTMQYTNKKCMCVCVCVCVCVCTFIYHQSGSTP